MKVRHWPITLKIPALVAGLMIVVSAVVTQQVISRLVDTQQRNLTALSDAYLAGISTSLVPHVLRGDIWEVYEGLERAQGLYPMLRPIDTIVVGADGLVIASSHPKTSPSFQPPPDDFVAELKGTDFARNEARNLAFAQQDLMYQGRRVGAIMASIDVSHLRQERDGVLMTLLLTNAALTLLLACSGYMIVRRMVHPMRILGDRLRAANEGPPQPIHASEMPRKGGEAYELFESYNGLVRAERQRQSLLLHVAAEERLASLGRLASGMAHEINNPLGGLFNALDTLRNFGDREGVRARSVALIEQGLKGIKDVVAAALHNYRPERDARPFGAQDLDDLKMLVQPEARRKGLSLRWSSELEGSYQVQKTPVRQAVLNLLLNACAATPAGGQVELVAKRVDDQVVICISDKGPGLPPAAMRLLTSEDAAPVGSSGLGLWMTRRSVSEAKGNISVTLRAEGGTTIRLSFPEVAEEEERERAVA
ncbi:sensor histidine kinase [Devosia naphthalenivorans]|uniref:sensor histidine kinase n=1 Tax=Devosia naphthalenivorans TaxID=2082392 RepID=UPI000D3720A9|nr:HAMP domain-containing sensor histidine kinase [Devosia naphthalenivorans]